MEDEKEEQKASSEPNADSTDDQTSDTEASGEALLSGDQLHEDVKSNPLEAMMKNFSKRERSIAYAAAFCILILVLDKIILGPILSRIDKLKDDITQEISIVRDGLLIIGYKDAIKSEYEALKKYFSTARKTQEEEIADFLKDMEILSMDSGVHLVTVNPSGNVENTREYTIYEINLNCTGTMENIITFLYKLSMSQKPTKIVSVELIPPSKGGAEVQCNMLISRMFTTI